MSLALALAVFICGLRAATGVSRVCRNSGQLSRMLFNILATMLISVFILAITPEIQDEYPETGMITDLGCEPYDS
jgi:hypothetical protein